MYLGIPLMTRKLRCGECKSLVQRITARISHQSSKTLSYAGRLQLVNSIVCSMQSYWAQIFVILKKLVKEVITICRNFLWAGTTGNSRKAHVAWSTLCKSKSYGGLNIRDLVLWNKAALLKLWAISEKKDRLWIRWVHHYIIKHDSIFYYKILKQTSQMLKKVGSLRELVQSQENWNSVLYKGEFSIKHTYQLLLGKFQKVVRRKICCNSLASPKCRFFMWLALQKQLPIVDRLRKWGMQVSDTCRLCGMGAETVDHILHV